VVFLSTVCPYANYFSKHIAELGRRHRDVLFVGVDSNQFETAEEVAEHAKEHGLAFPVVWDEGARVADLLGAKLTPEAFLVDAQGRLRYHGWVQSKLRSPDLQRALDAVLGGKAVRLAETKAFGCAIDRKR
jgi:peroxiredoxin